MNIKWTSKPKLNKRCLIICASFINGKWEYQLFQVHKTEGFNNKEEPIWYWGVFCGDGEEWGEYKDLKADKYCVID